VGRNGRGLLYTSYGSAGRRGRGRPYPADWLARTGTRRPHCALVVHPETKASMISAAGIPSPPTNGFAIGPLEVHYYALCILGGIVIASWVTASRLRAGDISGGSVIDVAIWGVPIALVGGRLYHVFTHPGDYFYPGANLWNVFAIWEGGLAIYGSILAGILGVWIGCRRTHVPFVTLVDALAPGMLFAQAFGRLGNYFNQELFGNPTTLPGGGAPDPHQQPRLSRRPPRGHTVPATVPLRAPLECRRRHPDPAARETVPAASRCADRAVLPLVWRRTRLPRDTPPRPHRARPRRAEVQHHRRHARRACRPRRHHHRVPTTQPRDGRPHTGHWCSCRR
jgi:hypothetical protein